jgi:hypothetical protein
MEFHTCTSTLSHGPRAGQPCGKNALYCHEGQWYCSRHKKIEDPLTLCTYGPHGIPLADIDVIAETLPEETEAAKEKMRQLRGYINLKIGAPIFKGTESLPLVFMSRVSKFAPTPDSLDRICIARELADTVDYLISRPDAYDVDINSTAELVLHSIKYDPVYGIFRAHFSKVT